MSSVRGSAPSHRPRRRFGQHFLATAWAGKLVAAIGPEPGDVFVEIGPGTGALTFPLAATGVPILAVEVDRDLAASLASRVPSHVTIVTGDFLTTDLASLLGGLAPQRPPDALRAAPGARRFRLAGNLPFNLSSPMLDRIIQWQRRGQLFSDATVMLQREVADRLVARAGTKAYGALTVLVRRHATVERVLELPPGAFSPRPKVSSTVVRLRFGSPPGPALDEVAFERLVKALFSQRRKTLSNALKRFDPRGPAVLAQSGFDPLRRPETLQVPEIERLAELFASSERPPVV
jgi:16S rRNA (adenine1518-N6/adenine1519-N6)-dimethyltransferase